MNDSQRASSSKQTKKRRWAWKEYVFLAALAFSIGAVFSFFASAVRMDVKSSSGDVITTYGPAYCFIFGGEIVSEYTSYSFKGPNGMLLSAWILMIVGLLGIAVATLFSFFSKLREETRTSIFLFGALCEGTASILLFSSKTALAKSLCVIFLGSCSENVANTIRSNLRLQFGVWGTGLFALFSAIIVLIVLIREKMLVRLFQAIAGKVKR